MAKALLYLRIVFERKFFWLYKNTQQLYTTENSYPLLFSKPLVF
jgi:hypothetical protein